MKRITRTLGALSLALGLMLAGCASNQEGSKSNASQGDAGKTKITYTTFWGSDNTRPLVEELVKKYNASQDKIEVEHVYVPWGDIWTKNIASIAAGNPVDLIVNDVASVPNRAFANQVEDLSELLQKDETFKESDYVSTYMDAMKYEGKIYGLPYAVDNRLIYFNKDHFKEAGLDPENPPKTWAQLKEAAFKLDKKNGASFDRIGFYPLFGNGGFMAWFTNADQGMQYYNPTTKQVAVDTPAKRKALEYIEIYRDHYGSSVLNEYEASFGQGLQNPFLSGKVSMLLQTPAFNNVIKTNKADMNYGVFAIPEMEPGNGMWSWGGGFNLEIPKGAKNKEAAYQFLRYLTSEEAQKFWVQKSFELSTLKSLQKDSTLLQDPVYKTASELLNTTSLGLYPLEYFGFQDYVNPKLDSFKLGQESVQGALEKAQKDLESYVKTK